MTAAFVDQDYGWEISCSGTIAEEASQQAKVCKTRPNELAGPPAHYGQSSLEPWDAIKAMGLNYFCGNILKYLYRKAHKGQLVEDSLKALNYLLKEISDDVTRAQVEALLSRHVFRNDIIDTEAS